MRASQRAPSQLSFLLALAGIKTRESRLERSWLDDATGIDGSRLPLMDVLIMALKFVFARKAVVAAVLAPNHRAWILQLLRVGAMLDGVMTYEIGPAFAGEGAVQLGAAECCSAYVSKMGFLVLDVIIITIAERVGEMVAGWEPASQPRDWLAFDSTEGETCDAGASIARFLGRSVSNDRYHVRIGFDPFGDRVLFNYAAYGDIVRVFRKAVHFGHAL